MAIKIGSLFLSGASLSGKSYFGTFLATLLNPVGASKTIVRVDASDMIRWGKQVQGAIGDDVRRHQSIMDAGGFLPDYVMIPLFYEWLADFCGKNPLVETLIICGAPRTQKQLELLGAFKRSLVIHLRTSPEMIAADLKRRIAESGSNIRKDDTGGIPVVQEKYRQYEEFTLPAIKELGDTVLHLDRSAELCDRLEKTFTYLLQMNGGSPVKRRFVKNALDRSEKDRQAVIDLYPSEKFPPDVFSLAQLGVDLPQPLSVLNQQSPFNLVHKVIASQQARC